MSDYISVGETQFLQILSAHSCIFMFKLYFRFYSLFCWTLGQAGINPCRDASDFSKYKLCDIFNCSRICAAQAVLGH